MVRTSSRHIQHCSGGKAASDASRNVPLCGSTKQEMINWTFNAIANNHDTCVQLTKSCPNAYLLTSQMTAANVIQIAVLQRFIYGFCYSS